MSTNSAFQVFSSYSFVFTLPGDQIANLGTMAVLPSFEESILHTLCEQAYSIFEKEPIVSEIEGDVIVVGDLHGSLHDLLRIINFCGIQRNKVLFLGDYVDRGEFSIEVITLLFALKILYPDTFFLLRGNHEFHSLCSTYGFKTDVLRYYSESLYNAFLEVFSVMPIAAIANKTTFCIHGGLSPDLKNISDLKKIERPIVDYDHDKLLSDVMWADPTINNFLNFTENPRGRGFLFSGLEVIKFLKNNHLSRLIRGHECVQNGVQFLFSYKLVTVFSASSYNTDMGNLSGLVVLHQFPEKSSNNMTPLGLTSARNHGGAGTSDLADNNSNGCQKNTSSQCDESNSNSNSCIKLNESTNTNFTSSQCLKPFTSHPPTLKNGPISIEGFVESARVLGPVPLGVLERKPTLLENKIFSKGNAAFTGRRNSGTILSEIFKKITLEEESKKNVYHNGCSQHFVEELDDVEEVFFEPLHRIPRERIDFKPITLSTEKDPSHTMLLTMMGTPSKLTLLKKSQNKIFDRKVAKYASHFLSGNGKTNAPVDKQLPALVKTVVTV